MKRQAKVAKTYKRTDLEIKVEEIAKTTVAWSVVKIDQSRRVGLSAWRGAVAGYKEGMKQIK